MGESRAKVEKSMSGKDGVDLASAVGESFIPSNWFTDQDIPRREREHLWSRVWQTACRVEELPEVGDYVTYEIAGESIIVVHTAADGIVAYYNVCQHRGRRLEDKPSGNVRNGFYCTFHGWRYDLDGALTHAPGEEDWPCGLKGRANLKRLRCETWGGWVWINIDPNAQPLIEWLGKVATTLAPLEFENMRRCWYKTIIAPVNWKVVVQAFNEGYHAGATHTGGISYRPMSSPTVDLTPHSMYFSNWTAWTRVKQNDQSWTEVKDLREHIHANCAHLYDTLFAMVLTPTMNAANRLMAEVPAGTPDEQVVAEFFRMQREETEKMGARWPSDLTLEKSFQLGTGWHVFPNTVFLPTVDGALWYRFRPHPTDPNACIFDMWSLGRFAPGREPKIEHEVYQGFDDFKGQNPFLEEDFENMLAVQAGMQSRGWEGALLNPVQEIQEGIFMRTHRKYVGE